MEEYKKLKNDYKKANIEIVKYNKFVKVCYYFKIIFININ